MMDSGSKCAFCSNQRWAKMRCHAPRWAGKQGERGPGIVLQCGPGRSGLGIEQAKRAAGGDGNDVRGSRLGGVRPVGQLMWLMWLQHGQGRAGPGPSIGTESGRTMMGMRTACENARATDVPLTRPQCITPSLYSAAWVSSAQPISLAQALRQHALDTTTHNIKGGPIMIFPVHVGTCITKTPTYANTWEGALGGRAHLLVVWQPS